MHLPMSERMQMVMDHARRQAAERQHEYVGTEHLLLGLASDFDGPVAKTFASFDITPERLQSFVERIDGTWRKFPPETLPISPKANEAIKSAMEQASRLGSSHIEPEHLFLGLLGISAMNIDWFLDELDVDAETVTKKFREVASGQNS